MATRPSSSKTKRRPDAKRGWLDDLRNAYAIHNVVSLRPELPFFLIRWDGEQLLEWMELGDPSHRTKPFHFEIYFGKEAIRDAHYLAALKRAARSGEPVLKDLFGFWDLFCPLPADDQHRTFLYAGQFLREPPEWESLSDSWRTLTGQEPASANPDFVQFVRMALALPILEAELLDAVIEFAKLRATFLSRQGRGTRIQQQVDALNADQFARLWPINDWVDSVISDNRFRLPPWYFTGELTDWMKEGMRIDRLPSTAMALMPLDSRADALDPVQTLVRNARIQRACITFARDLPETAATTLQDYGVSIITSAKRGKSAARARVELRECAGKFRAFVRERFKTRVAVGIGRTLPAGSSLHASHRDAVIALHMCVQLGKDLLFYDEHGGDQTQLSYTELQQAADDVTEALDRENSTEIKLASDRYVRLVLQYANERIEVARSQFLAMLFQLFGTVQRRNPMRKDVRDSFASDLTARLEDARSLNQLIEAWGEALQRLAFVSSEVWHGPSVLRLEATLQYLRENFAEQLPLPQVARKAGFSVPAFTRVFKQATGTSFLAYLRGIRVEHAKKLLTTTPMTTEQIAHACGFNSQHHLIRSFKKVTEQTPGAYRKAKTRGRRRG